MLNIFSTGHEWNNELLKAAVARGFPVRSTGAVSMLKPGSIFYIPRQFPGRDCVADKQFALRQMPVDPTYQWIADRTQIQCYESKIWQTELFSNWMPETKLFTWYSDAVAYLEGLPRDAFPIVSKSSVGSASSNVRLLNGRFQAREELDQVFARGGLPIRQGPGPSALQKDYVIWQEFVPHEFTWRVTVVGSKFHVYKRFNFDDRPMAAPSKVKPTEPAAMSPEVESLLVWSAQFFHEASTKWCAIDVLKSCGRWKLLETSLAWARGNDAAGNARFYGTKRSLNTQFELLLDEIERTPW